MQASGGATDGCCHLDGLVGIVPELPQGYLLRPMSVADIEPIGRLYCASYPPGDAGADEQEAMDDIRAAFEGEYGQLWRDASPVAEHDGRIVGAIQVVGARRGRFAWRSESSSWRRR